VLCVFFCYDGDWISSPEFCMANTIGLGMLVAQRLKCCAINRKVAGSIPDGVSGNFSWT